MLPNTEFTLRVDGTPFHGWEDASILRSIERMSGMFNITASNLPEEWSGFPMGKPVSLEFDERKVLSGWVDKVTPNYDDRATFIRISGRDAVSDLLDCAATVNDNFEFANQKIENVIRQILAPYGIPLRVDVDTGEVISKNKKLSIQPGETAFDFIERLCRVRAILPISDGVGGLVLTKPGASRSNGRIVHGENVISGEADIDWTERFSLYVVKGSGEADEFSSVEDVSEPEGRAEDPAINRYRPKVILSESEGYDLSFQERATWEKQFNQSRSRRATYKVQGFYTDENKTIWKPNEIVPVRDPVLMINRDMLIVSTLFEKSDQGSFTTLELAIPESFDLPAEKAADEEDFWGAI